PGGALGGHVAEGAGAVVLQQVARGRQPIALRKHAAADEQVEVAVAVEVGGADAGAVGEDVGEGILGAGEAATPVVNVEAVPERLGLAPGLIAAADDVEVLVAVAV